MNKHDVFIYSLKILGIVILVGAGLFAWSRTMDKKALSETTIGHPAWTRNANIYEVNIRQYTPEGTFKAFEKSLPRLKQMGVDILWLMPINPIGVVNRKGTLGSYYAVQDYLGVNKEYGTLMDLKNLVKHAHELGMHVIIDWVANHTSWDNILVTTHPDWYTHDSTGKIIHPVADWTDVADLNYDQPGLRQYMTDALIYWVRAADIDGFRCDVAGMVPLDFWNAAIPEIKKVKNVFMLAEDETPAIHQNGFDMTYSWNLRNLLEEVIKGKKTANALDSLLAKEKDEFPADAYRMHFTSNHDINSWEGSEYERMGDGAKTAAVFCYTVPGMPLIYSGQESAFNHRIKFFDKDNIEWDHYSLQKFYTTLNKMKTDNAVLWNGAAGGAMTKVHTDNDKNIYAFLRSNPKGTIFVILNLSAAAHQVRLHSLDCAGDYTEVFTSQKETFTGKETISLKPWEYRVYIKK